MEVENHVDQPAKKEGVLSRQISGMDAKNHYILSVLAKRTYRINHKGICIPDAETIPLVEELTYYPDTNEELLAHDLDIYAFKLFTDVVVKGHAYPHAEVNQFEASVKIGKNSTSFLVMGDRKTGFNKMGRVIFSEPEIVEKIPLSYTHAYGGWDRIGEYKLESHSEKRIKMLPADIDWQNGSLYQYPRNPMGKGYLVDLNREAIDTLELPNLEDPKDRLLPERIAAGIKSRWTEMPIPRCTDWVSPTWFPRVVYFGLSENSAQPHHLVTEVERGWAAEDLMDQLPPQLRFNYRCTQGASLGLQLPFLKGDEPCRLTNLHPQIADFQFQLPNKIPRIWVDGRNGKLIETTPILQNLVIEPELNRLSLVWRGSAVALRPYLEEELLSMPFKVKWPSF